MFSNELKSKIQTELSDMKTNGLFKAEKVVEDENCFLK